MTDDIARAVAESGCKDIETLAMLQAIDVGRLTLRDPTTGVEEPLGMTHKRVLNIALLFFCEDKADVYDHTKFMALTAKDWKDFNRDQRLASRKAGASGTPSTTAGGPAPTATSTSSSYKPVESFKRGIKRDTSAFPTLNDENNQDQWHKDMQVQACAQGVDDVLDATYVPANADELALFTEKQKFVYAVLTKVVLTYQGKTIVRKHYDKKGSDAQTAYKELHVYHLTSFNANDRSGKLLKFLTTETLTDWDGPTENFILYWSKQRKACLLYTSPSPRDLSTSRMPSSA